MGGGLQQPDSEGVANRLSVVVPTYNRARLVGRAVKSVLDSGFPDIEVIVVDDGGEDGTDEVVRSLKDSRVQYLHIEHSGVSTARNLGAMLASGRWLAFLDSDDEVLPGWAIGMVSAAERSAQVAVCGGEAVDASGRTLWSWVPIMPHHPLEQVFAERFLAGLFVVDRNTFLDSGGYDEKLEFGENTELALRLLFRSNTAVAVDRRVLLRMNVARARWTYGSRVTASAQYVLDNHHWLRDRLPDLWSSYHAILGVAAAQDRVWPAARSHFLAAATVTPSGQHLGRLFVSTLPPIASLVWRRHGQPSADRASVRAGRLRLLLVVPEYPPAETGGIASYAQDLAIGLAKQGHDTHVLVVRRDQPSSDDRDGSVLVHRRAQIRFVGRGRVAEEKWLRRLDDASFVQRMAHSISCRYHYQRLGGGFDVVEACDWMAGGLLLGSSGKPGLVIHVHGAAAMVERRGRPSISARISEQLERTALRRADVVTAPSPKLAARTRVQVGPHTRIRLVPCPAQVREEPALRPDGPPVVLYVGRLDWLKAPEVLVRAGALLRADFPDIEIRFVGRSSGKREGLPYGEWLTHLAETEGSPSRFIGPRDHSEVLSLISSSSVVAVTSRFEAFGLSAAEALAQGRPAVCTDRCGIAYLLSPPAGAVVPFDDPLALARALGRFLPGGEDEDRAPYAALRLAQRHLAISIVAREKLACYREAVAP